MWFCTCAEISGGPSWFEARPSERGCQTGGTACVSTEHPCLERHGRWGTLRIFLRASIGVCIKFALCTFLPLFISLGNAITLPGSTLQLEIHERAKVSCSICSRLLRICYIACVLLCPQFVCTGSCDDRCRVLGRVIRPNSRYVEQAVRTARDCNPSQFTENEVTAHRATASSPDETPGFASIL